MSLRDCEPSELLWISTNKQAFCDWWGVLDYHQLDNKKRMLLYILLYYYFVCLLPAIVNLGERSQHSGTSEFPLDSHELLGWLRCSEWPVALQLLTTSQIGQQIKRSRKLPLHLGGTSCFKVHPNADATERLIIVGWRSFSNSDCINNTEYACAWLHLVTNTTVFLCPDFLSGRPKERVHF